MQTELTTLRDSSQGSTPSKRKTNRKTPDNPSFTRRKTDKYCWTHGGCTHESKDCMAKAQGHQNNATFSDKKGGSKAFCE